MATLMQSETATTADKHDGVTRRDSSRSVASRKTKMAATLRMEHDDKGNGGIKNMESPDHFLLCVCVIRYHANAQLSVQIVTRLGTLAAEWPMKILHGCPNPNVGL